MDITIGYKIGALILTGLTSFLLAWFDFPEHSGMLAAFIVFITGMMAIFCYELFLRMRSDLGKKHRGQERLVIAVQKELGELKQGQKLILEQITGSISAVQKELEKTTGNISAVQKELEKTTGNISAVQKELEKTTGSISAVQKDLGKLNQGQELILERTISMADMQLAQSHVMHRTDRIAESLSKLVEHTQRSADKEANKTDVLETLKEQLQTSIGLQRTLEIIVKNDVQSREKPFEIVEGSGELEAYATNHIKVVSGERIPNIIHFCFGFDRGFGQIPFSFHHYMTIKLAHEMNRPDKIFFFYKYEPQGKWWQESKKFLTLIKVDAPHSIFGNPLCHYAHKTDVFRLEILLKYGGIYLDLDVWCIRPFKPLLNNNLVMGMQEKRGLCNAVILSEPDSEFLRIWYNSYNNFRSIGRDDYWDEHSVLLPFELAKENPQLIHVEDERAFFYPDCAQKDFQWESAEIDTDKSYCVHLAENANWGRYLKDMTPEFLKKGNSKFTEFFKNYV